MSQIILSYEIQQLGLSPKLNWSRRPKLIRWKNDLVLHPWLSWTVNKNNVDNIGTKILQYGSSAKSNCSRRQKSMWWKIDLVLHSWIAWIVKHEQSTTIIQILSNQLKQLHQFYWKTTENINSDIESNDRIDINIV